jgi:hypothetical protein
VYEVLFASLHATESQRARDEYPTSPCHFFGALVALSVALHHGLDGATTAHQARFLCKAAKKRVYRAAALRRGAGVGGFQELLQAFSSGRAAAAPADELARQRRRAAGEDQAARPSSSSSSSSSSSAAASSAQSLTTAAGAGKREVLLAMAERDGAVPAQDDKEATFPGGKQRVGKYWTLRLAKALDGKKAAVVDVEWLAARHPALEESWARAKQARAVAVARAAASGTAVQ